MGNFWVKGKIAFIPPNPPQIPCEIYILTVDNYKVIKSYLFEENTVDVKVKSWVKLKSGSGKVKFNTNVGSGSGQLLIANQPNNAAKKFENGSSFQNWATW